MKNDQNFMDIVESESRIDNTCYNNKECQVNFFVDNENNESTITFFCNRTVINNVCDAEIQTEISFKDKSNASSVIIHKRRKFVNKGCNTE